MNTYQFARTRLTFGKENMEKLYNARVIVFGIGGVGSYVVEALVRSGIGAIDIVDDDRICLTNLNRQLYALRSTIGKDKVDVAEERIHDINPDCKVTKWKTFYSRLCSQLKLQFLRRLMSLILILKILPELHLTAKELQKNRLPAAMPSCLRLQE